METSSLEDTPPPMGSRSQKKFPGPEKGFPERVYLPLYPENEQLAQRFCVYPDFKAAVCIPCMTLLSAVAIVGHVRRHHPLYQQQYTASIQVEAKEFIERNTRGWGNLEEPPKSLWWCRPPAHVTVVEASRCQSCGYVTCFSRVWDRHACCAPSEMGPAAWEAVYAFKWGSTKHCIPVTQSDVDVQGVQANDLLDQLFEYTDGPGSATDNGEGACDLDPFNNRCGFSTFKKTLNNTEKRAMLAHAKVRRSDPRYKEYVRHLDRVMEDLQGTLDVRVELRSVMGKLHEK
jgi:hypothetical protein